MSARLSALAREKEILLLRSSLARLRLRIASERIRSSPVAVAAARARWLAGIARTLLR